jgi:transcriptional regulator with XRE-family HTH domain
MQANMAHIGDKLKRERTLAPLTQEELAQKAGLTTATVARIERDEVEPRPSTLRKLAAALGVQPRELIEGPKDA